MKKFTRIIIFSAIFVPFILFGQTPPVTTGERSAPAGCEAAFTYEQDSTDLLVFNFYDHSLGTISDYSWDFGDGSTGSGQVLSHSFPVIGTYKVCLTISNNDTANYCSDSVCVIIDLDPQPKYLLGGLLYAGNFPINNPFNTNDKAYAYLYRLQAGAMEPIDTVQFDTLGYYYFTDVPAGNYLVKGGLMSNSAHFSTYMPGYYKESSRWEESDTLRLENDFFMAHIHMVPLTEMEPGNNSFIGYVLADNRLAMLDRIGECEIILSDSAGNPVRVVYTDQAGNFRFDMVPMGHYSLKAEFTGLYSDVVQVVADEFNQVSDSVEIRLHYSPQGIGQARPDAAFDLTVYPNPASGKLNLDLRAVRDLDVTYELISTMGASVLRDGMRLTTGTTKAHIDITTCPSGLYVLTVRENATGAMVSSKVIIR